MFSNGETAYKGAKRYQGKTGHPKNMILRAKKGNSTIKKKPFGVTRVRRAEILEVPRKTGEKKKGSIFERGERFLETGYHLS